MPIYEYQFEDSEGNIQTVDRIFSYSERPQEITLEDGTVAKLIPSLFGTAMGRTRHMKEFGCSRERFDRMNHLKDARAKRQKKHDPRTRAGFSNELHAGTELQDGTYAAPSGVKTVEQAKAEAEAANRALPAGVLPPPGPGKPNLEQLKKVAK